MRRRQGIPTHRVDLEIDTQESDRQRAETAIFWKTTWTMTCIECGKPYESLPVPKCCVNNLKCEECLGE
jgi:hypothetical protein